ncbi:PF20097 family protein [Vagococcus fluvialis]|uniref:PF20097 family protein n=1 Tax=Vagococcus fluvialis TaxID=2738 RepID=UPI003B5B7C29
MNCGTCSKEMIKGNLFGDRYALKWLPDDKKLIGGTFINAADGIVLKKNSSLVGRPRNEAFVCDNCGHLVIDLNSQQAK